MIRVVVLSLLSVWNYTVRQLHRALFAADVTRWLLACLALALLTLIGGGAKATASAIMQMLSLRSKFVRALTFGGICQQTASGVCRILTLTYQSVHARLNEYEWFLCQNIKAEAILLKNMGVISYVTYTCTRCAAGSLTNLAMHARLDDPDDCSDTSSDAPSLIHDYDSDCDSDVEDESQPTCANTTCNADTNTYTGDTAARDSALRTVVEYYVAKMAPIIRALRANPGHRPDDHAEYQDVLHERVAMLAIAAQTGHAVPPGTSPDELLRWPLGQS